jgi:uncharacterized RDD family membrane protein YckC
MTSSQPPNSDSKPPEERDLWRILQDDSEAERAEEPLPDDPGSAGETTSAASEGITQIERILSDPESMVDTVDFRPTADEDDDYDAAIRNFYRDTGTTVMCKDHPEVPSVDQCPQCEAYYCQECLVVRRGRLICRTCAVSEYVPTEEEILEAQEFGQGETPAEITPEERPEFQVGSALLGLEGRPTHPLKRLVALAVDLLITRLMVLVLAAIAGGLLSHQPGAFFHLFDQAQGEPIVARFYQAFVLLRPVVPWLIIFAVIDFLYLFLSMSFFNRTLGMSWLSCRLVTEWGDFVGFGAVALRTLVFMVCLGWPSILLAWFFPAFRGPHDYAAGTIVINYSGNKRVDSYDTVQIRLD